MIALDEDALECDLAECYNIYDMGSLSADKIATFSVGLRENSRIKMKLAGYRYPLETLLIASAVDRLSILVWSKTKDAQKGINKPASIVERLTNPEGKKDKDLMSFDSVDDFEAALKEIDEKFKEG